MRIFGDSSIHNFDHKLIVDFKNSVLQYIFASPTN